MIKLYPLTSSESKIWFWTLCPKQNCLRDTRYPKTKYSFRRDKEILDLRTPPKHLSCRFLKKRQRLLTLCIGENSFHWKWWEDWLKPAEAEKNWLTSVTENPKGYSDLRFCRVWVPKHYCEGSAPMSQLRCPMCGFFFSRGLFPFTNNSGHLQFQIYVLPDQQLWEEQRAFQGWYNGTPRTGSGGPSSGHKILLVSLWIWNCPARSEMGKKVVAPRKQP